MSYVYLKKGHSPTDKSSFSKRLTKATKKKLAILLFVAGIVLLSSAIYPILSFSLKYTGQFSLNFTIKALYWAKPTLITLILVTGLFKMAKPI